MLVVSFLVGLLDITSNFVVVLLTGSAVIFAEMSDSCELWRHVQNVIVPLGTHVNLV